MHSKLKGNVGQFATALCLSKLGYSVFTEEGDISKIDLIAECKGSLLKFQCKSITPVKNKLCLPLRKTGPNYCVTYREEDLDYFSVYDLFNDNLYFVPSSILREFKNTFILRLTKPKNNYVKGVRFAEDFLAEKILSKN